MKACACSDSRSWAFIRDDLNAPDSVAPAEAVPGGVLPPAGYPGDGGVDSLPYPTLPPIPPADAQPAPVPDVDPAPARPVTPPAPRKAPQAKKSEDTIFF